MPDELERIRTQLASRIVRGLPADGARQKAAAHDAGPLLAKAKALYNDQSRQEVPDASVQVLARAVAVLHDREPGEPLQTLQEALGLCRDEPFANEPRLGYGTGFLVGSDRVLTARHCVRGREQDKIRMRFGWTHGSAEVLEHTGRVAETGEGHDDWALIALDRPVDALPLVVEPDDPERGAYVWMLGHPNGIPMKVARNAKVIGSVDEYHVRTDLDAFFGNSGSPVLNERGRVCGMLVAGNDDYIDNGRCLRARTFPRGEADEWVLRPSRFPTRRGIETMPTPPVDLVRPRDQAPPRVPPRRLLYDHLYAAYPTRSSYAKLSFEPYFEELAPDHTTAGTRATTLVEEIWARGWHTEPELYSILRADRLARSPSIDAIEAAVRGER